MDRRLFLQQTAAATALAAAGLSGCGKDGDDSGGTATGTTTGSTTGGTTSTGTTGGLPAGSTSSGTATGTATGSTGGCAQSQAQAQDSEGHGHHLVIPLADWQAGNAGSYLTTASNHDHTVSLNAQQMADLAANCTVTVNSNDTHPHTWVITIS